MDDSSALRDKMYEAYLEFCNVAERKRHWDIFDDVPWDQLDDSLNSESKAARIEIYCAEEFYLPDYTAGGIELTRSIFGAAWFQARWSYEESKHGLVFREYLTRSGIRSQQDFARFEDAVFAAKWKLPFATRRQMVCYGALQEAATYLAYKDQREQAAREGDKVLEAIFSFVSRDEAAHAGFYRTMARMELEADRAGTVADLALVVALFQMPGVGLIPNYQQRLRESGAGISTRHFVQHALLPLLKILGTNRAELLNGRECRSR
jgi:acyl-[acyl-carrier-protein] desaturase